MISNRSLAVALVGGLALLGSACGSTGSTKASAAAADTATTAASVAGATTATTVAGDSAAATMPGVPRGDGNGFGDGGRGGPGGFGQIDAAAKAIGMTTTELQAAITNGQTIAQVAQANNVSVDTVVASMVAAMKAHFDPEVASGEHTQAEVDQMMANATAEMTAVVNGQQPAFGPGGDRPGGDDDNGGGAPAGSTGRKASTGQSTTTVGA